MSESIPHRQQFTANNASPLYQIYQPPNTSNTASHWQLLQEAVGQSKSPRTESPQPEESIHPDGGTHDGVI